MSLDPVEGDWLFGDSRRRGNGAGEIVALVSDLAGCSATELQTVMRRSDPGWGTDGLLLSEVDEAYFDESESFVTCIAFRLHENKLTLEIDFLVDHFDDEDEQERLVSRILAPFLRRHRMAVIGSWMNSGSTSPPWVWHARIGFATRNRTLDALYQVGLDAIALMDALRSGELTRETAGDLVRGGQATVLIGQPEGSWLDAKSQHYDLSTARGQISLAQSVTRFCNAEGGGVIVVGMSTKKVPGGEEIRGVCPVPLDKGIVRKYEQALEVRVFPPPDNLSVEFVPEEPGMLVLIDIPPQPEELKPFLVHGAVVDDHVEGSFISIVRRRGESSIPITAPMIHSTLAAGRALLRRGELPAHNEDQGSH
ncbi:hypothetical protein OHS32_26085 [Micromonospora chokoriensis]